MSLQEFQKISAKRLNLLGPLSENRGFLGFRCRSWEAEVWLLTVSKTELLNSLIRIIGDREASAALRYEASRGGALFAHLYAPLPLAAVLEARPYRANEVLD